MTTRTLGGQRLVLMLALLGAVAAACSLNPQPIPPGIEDTTSDDPDASPIDPENDNFGADAGAGPATAQGDAGPEAATPVLERAEAGAEAGPGDGGHDAGDSGNDADSG